MVDLIKAHPAVKSLKIKSEIHLNMDRWLTDRYVSHTKTNEHIDKIHLNVRLPSPSWSSK
jgi:hypothetical protein